jgi:hypothetical protein
VQPEPGHSFYVLADSGKSGRYLGEQPIHERVPADVRSEAPAGLVVQKSLLRYHTVACRVSWVIHERGVLSADDVRRAGKSIRIIGNNTGNHRRSQKRALEQLSKSPTVFCTISTYNDHRLTALNCS